MMTKNLSKNMVVGLFVMAAPAVLSAETAFKQLETLAGPQAASALESPPAARPALAAAPQQPESRPPFEILKSLYESATQPAGPSDFPFFDDRKNPQKCVIADNKGWMHYVHVGKIAKTIPGRPSYGPIFPGTPDTRVEKVALLSLSDPLRLVSLSDPLGLFDVIENRQSNLEFIIHVDKIWDDVTWTMRLRKKQGFVVWRLTLREDDASRSVDFYGYCYQGS